MDPPLKHRTTFWSYEKQEIYGERFDLVLQIPSSGLLVWMASSYNLSPKAAQASTSSQHIRLDGFHFQQM